MRNLRSYYSSTIADFLRRPTAEILGIIHSNDISSDARIQQSNTWEIEVDILKEQLRDYADGRIIFEYTIPRMGKRVDTVVLNRNIVFFWSSRRRHGAPCKFVCSGLILRARPEQFQEGKSR